jgi:hypothetical protein
MKKILVIHNKYKNRGGEDIAVENELLMLNKEYKIETLVFDNNDKNYFNIFLNFVLNKNLKSMALLESKIKTFKPDIAYVHNTWFIGSSGIFEILEKNNIKTLVKLHNFRYFCTKSFFVKSHLGNTDFCMACGLKRKKFQIFNKYFDNSYIKSFFVCRYGRKYFKILKCNNIKILVLTHFHKNFLSKLGISEQKISTVSNTL